MLSSFPVVLLETMSHYTDEPRFTIEQIDLLQRLRRTGMTKHEILHALETLDRLDQEHSDKFGRRSSYGEAHMGTVPTTFQHLPLQPQLPRRPSTRECPHHPATVTIPPHCLALPIKMGGRTMIDCPHPMGRCHHLATMQTAWVRGHIALRPQKRT